MLRSLTRCFVLLLVSSSGALSAETGMLYVKSDPPGAAVFIDGKERGETPVLVRNVEPGQRVVVVRPPGGPGQEEIVTVEAGKVAKLDVRISQEPASLTVISDPLEASVHLDRRERGKTPVTIEELAPGEHEVILVLDDYERTVKKLHLKSGENRVLEIKLRRTGAPPLAEGEKPREVEATDEAERKLAAVLDGLCAMIGRGDCARARKLAEESAKSRELVPVAVPLLAAARVAKALEDRRDAIRRGAKELTGKRVMLRTKAGPREGTVENVTEKGITLSTEIRMRGKVAGKTTFTVAWNDLTDAQGNEVAKGWDRQGPDASIALAFLALARGDLAAAGRAAAAAGDHVLAGYVSAKAQAAKRSPAEDAARKGDKEAAKAAQRLAEMTRASLLTRDEAVTLLKALTVFQRTQGPNGHAGADPKTLLTAEARASLRSAIAMHDEVTRGSRARLERVAPGTYAHYLNGVATGKTMVLYENRGIRNLRGEEGGSRRWSIMPDRKLRLKWINGQDQLEMKIGRIDGLYRLVWHSVLRDPFILCKK